MLGGGRDRKFHLKRNYAWQGLWEADYEYFYGSAMFSTGSCGK